jgi:hypothetical protein
MRGILSPGIEVFQRLLMRIEVVTVAQGDTAQCWLPAWPRLCRSRPSG